MTGRTPRVFIAEHQPFDYSHAGTYGEFVTLKADKLAPNAPDDDFNRAVVEDLRRQMFYYIPGFDYLIPTGAPSRIALVAMLADEKSPDQRVFHNLLGWDAKTQRYLNYKVPLRR